MPIKGLKGGIGTKALGYGLGAAEEETEPNFNQTVLLLHGDGTEGAGDTAALGDPNFKAFRDNSTSAHALKADAQAYGNGFSPHYYADGYWSVRFKAGTGSITIPDSSDFTFGSNNFSIGVWVFRTDNNASTEHGIAHTGGGSYTSWLLTTKKFWGTTSGSSWDIQINYSSDIALNQWVYLQINRVGNVYTAYHDGSSVGTTTVSGSLYDNSDSFQIGARGGTTEFNGFLSNLIVTNGGNLSGTSVPTAPTTTDSNTKLLCLQSNRFLDNSATGHVLSPTVTDANAPEISSATPFTVTKTANVGSGFFDGTDDHVETIDTSSDFNLGTGEFTFEAWVYTQSTNQQTIVISSGGTDFNIYLHDSAVHVYSSSVVVDGNSASVESFVQKNAWNHVVVQRDSSSYLTVYVNGVRKYYTVKVTDYGANDKIRIGEHTNDSNGFQGYIADVRFVKGSAVYSGATITVPTSSLTAVTNTKLLTCQYEGAVRNVGFTDDSKSRHVVTRNGEASMGTFTPFSLEDGYWSTYPNTASDAWVRFLGSGATDFNLDDEASWCVEFFLYMEDNSIAYQRVAEQYTNGAYWAIKFDKDSNGTICIGATDTSDNGIIQSASAIPEYQWVHVAFTNDGSTLRLFVDGALSSSASSWTQPWTNASSGTPSIQLGNYRSINGYQTRGYISNFRIVKGSSVYTSAFSVPTEPLTAITNTVLLCAQSNRHLDNSTNGYAESAGATDGPKILPFSPFAPSRSYSRDVVGGSLFVDGSGDGLTTGTHTDFAFGTGDFTFESFVYPVTDTSSGTKVILDMRDANNTDTDHLSAITWIGSQMSCYSGANYNSGTDLALPRSAWTHMAVQRISNVLYFSTNGKVSSTAPSFTNNLSASGKVSLGGNVGLGTSMFTGYISNTRLIKGTGIYGTSNFSIPTAPFLDSDSNYDKTVFLTRLDSGGIIDHTMKNNLDTVNNVRVRTDVKKFGTGSIYFDGTDSIRWNQIAGASNGMAIGTGPFTVEFFVYFDGNPNNGGTNGQASLIRDAGSSFVIQRYDGEWEVGTEPTPQIQVATTVANETWLHVALTRDSSNNLKLFIDGTQTGSTATSFTTNFNKNEWHLGALNADASGGRALIGYMDEIRITAGVARYTSNFTAPTQSFANR